MKPERRRSGRRGFDAILAETHQNRVSDRPSTVYHYGGWEAFARIVTDQCFRATQHREIRDDPHEVASADPIIEGVARDFLRKARSSVQVQAVQAFLGHYGTMRLAYRASVYLTCFTSLSDDATLWRKFGRDKLGEAGTGICLGFKIIEKETRSARPYIVREGEKVPVRGFGVELMRVEYNAETVRRELQAIFAKVLRTKSNDWSATAANLQRNAAFSSACYKPAAYAFEQEWRLAAMRMGMEEEKYIYIPIRDPAKGMAEFAEIVLGPARKDGNTVERAEGILRAAGYGTAEVPMPHVRFSAQAIEDAGPVPDAQAEHRYRR